MARANVFAAWGCRCSAGFGRSPGGVGSTSADDQKVESRDRMARGRASPWAGYGFSAGASGNGCTSGSRGAHEAGHRRFSAAAASGEGAVAEVPRNASPQPASVEQGSPTLSTAGTASSDGRGTSGSHERRARLVSRLVQADKHGDRARVPGGGRRKKVKEQPPPLPMLGGVGTLPNKKASASQVV